MAPRGRGTKSPKGHGKLTFKFSSKINTRSVKVEEKPILGLNLKEVVDGKRTPLQDETQRPGRSRQTTRNRKLSSIKSVPDNCTPIMSSPKKFSPGKPITRKSSLSPLATSCKASSSPRKASPSPQTTTRDSSPGNLVTSIKSSPNNRRPSSLQLKLSPTETVSVESTSTGGKKSLHKKGISSIKISIIEEEVPRLDDSKDSINGDDLVVVKVFVCGFCSKRAKSKADMVKHVRTHTGERPYKCQFCDASFVQVTALRGHEKIHTGEKPFECGECHKSFAIKDRLRLHMRRHTGEKPYKCNVCHVSFARRSQQTTHELTHSKVKTHKCEECNARFSSYHSLKGHMQGHRGIKEFQCTVCGKKFLRVEGMYKHVRTVHRGSRPYTCNICGKSFKGHLQQHMRLHLGMRPHSCKTCGASFTQNSQLTVHMRIHTGERPYKCQICNAAFAHSSACKIHMRSHTGEKPFQCLICGTSFSQLPHLKKHMRCVHNAAKPYLCCDCHEYFQTQNELELHMKLAHDVIKTPQEEAEETVEEASLARLRNRLAVLLYRISSEERRKKFGFGTQLIDEVLKLSLESAGHDPIRNKKLSVLDELRQNVLTLLKWTIPKETMEEYHKSNMTVDEVIDMLTS